MTTLAEQINRRAGRMEALASDLAGLKPDYNPTELEMLRARELQAALARVFDAEIGPPQQAADTTGVPAQSPEAPGKKAKK
ncbi:MAG: hypothetical protein V1742_09880 [Pseudomonadota bacterium]